MGFLEVVTGYTKDGENHALSPKDFVRLIAKEMTFNGKNVDVSDSKEIDHIFEELERANETYDVDADVEIILFDDLTDCKGEGKLTFGCFDEYMEILGMVYTDLRYKECPGICIGTACCFEGIIVNITGPCGEEYNIELQERFEAAMGWIEKLKTSSRITKDWKFATKNNCCS